MSRGHFFDKIESLYTTINDKMWGGSMPFPFSFTGAIPFYIERGFNKRKFNEALTKALVENNASEVECSESEIHFRGMTSYRSNKPLVNIERGKLTIREHRSSGRVQYNIDYERWSILGGFLFPLFGIAVWFASKNWIFLVFGLGVGLFVFLNFFLVQFRFSRWLARTVDHQLTS